MATGQSSSLRGRPNPNKLLATIVHHIYCSAPLYLSHWRPLRLSAVSVSVGLNPNPFPHHPTAHQPGVRETILLATSFFHVEVFFVLPLCFSSCFNSLVGPRNPFPSSSSSFSCCYIPVTGHHTSEKLFFCCSLLCHLPGSLSIYFSSSFIVLLITMLTITE